MKLEGIIFLVVGIILTAVTIFFLADQKLMGALDIVVFVTSVVLDLVFILGGIYCCLA